MDVKIQCYNRTTNLQERDFLKEQLYQITWEIHSGLNEFYRKEWKVFKTREEALEYCCTQEKEWNFGLSHEEIANREGYYYELYRFDEIKEIDGHKIHLSAI